MTKTIYEYTDDVCRVALLDNGWLVVNGTDAKLPNEERRKLAAALATQGAEEPATPGTPDEESSLPRLPQWFLDWRVDPARWPRG